MVASLTPAQGWRCDWSAVGIGGGAPAGAGYRCGVTAGQTAAGELTGPLFRALIGFWQADYHTGAIEKPSPDPGQYETRLEAIAPNPGPARTRVSYSLAVAGPVSLTVHDLSGRKVRTLVREPQQPGRHVVAWPGDDDAGRSLADGVYFCRLEFGATRSTCRFVLVR